MLMLTLTLCRLTGAAVLVSLLTRGSVQINAVDVHVVLFSESLLLASCQ